MKDTELMRGHILLAYKGDGWKNKVNSMSSSQVLAVYKRLVKVGRIKGF